MKETKKHIDVFEYYYQLGEKRTFKLVESKYNVSNMSVARWSKAFNWQERIYQRDKAIAEQIEKQVIKDMAESKIKELADIRRMKTYPKAILNTIIENEQLKVKIQNASDLDAVIRAWERLIKVELLLSGEVTERAEQKTSGHLTIEQIWEKIIQKKKDDTSDK